MGEPLTETHEIPASDFERGIEYGNMLHRLDAVERRVDDYIATHDMVHAELNTRLDTTATVSEVALDMASDAHTEAIEAHEHASAAVEAAVETPAEIADEIVDAVEEVVEEVAEETHDEPILVGEPEPTHTEPPPEPRVDHHRRGGVYGKRR